MRSRPTPPNAQTKATVAYTRCLGLLNPKMIFGTLAVSNAMHSGIRTSTAGVAIGSYLVATTVAALAANASAPAASGMPLDASAPGRRLARPAVRVSAWCRLCPTHLTKIATGRLHTEATSATKSIQNSPVVLVAHRVSPAQDNPTPHTTVKASVNREYISNTLAPAGMRAHTSVPPKISRKAPNTGRALRKLTSIDSHVGAAPLPREYHSLGQGLST